MPARPLSVLFVVVLIATGAIFLASCGSTNTTPQPNVPPTSLKLSLNTVVSGLSSPVDLEVSADNIGRLFVVEQPGTIRIISNSALLPTPFLDISSQVDFGGEKGLLGLAFHPSYSQNRRFFVNYDRVVGGQMQTVISEFEASATNPNLADRTTERILFTVDQPFPNHKGGQLVFGPDSFLDIGLGDGGSGGDPLRNGQNLETMLGKMLRIDVDHTSSGLPYAIPPDNPFASGGGLPEIWSYGLRNPWRFSFDRPSGRLFCADVGQEHYEEVDILQKGGNFGWNIMEGLHCFNSASGCNMSGLTLPIAEYDHTEGDAVIGGYVYHGTAIPQLADTYLLSDFGSGTIWNLTESPPGTWTRTRLLSTGRNVSSFGQDSSGELYVLDYSGSVLKLVAQ